MPTVYSTLSYLQQRIYQDLQEKLETFQTEFVYKDISFDALGVIFKAVLEDHPELFWLTGAGSGTTRISGSLSSVEFRPEFYESTSVAQARSEKKNFEAKVSELVLSARRHSSDIYEQIVFLHDYMVKHSDYRMNAPHCFDAYGCLVLGHAVCSGYAAAFQVLMNRLGVECGRMRGNSASALTGDVSHVWNYVRLQDGYYFVDVTWDDPVVSSGSSRSDLSHDYFGLSLSELRLTHRFPSDQFIPASYGSKYDYYRHYGMFVERYSFETVKSIAQKQLVNGDKFSVKFGSQAQMALAIHDLLDRQRIYSIPGVPNRVSYGKSKSGLILDVYCGKC